MTSHRVGRRASILSLVASPLLLACSSASTTPPVEPSRDTSTGKNPGDDSSLICGPQAPRDISKAGGENAEPVPAGETPNLCNVHFHEPFEHAGFRWAGDTPGASGDEVCKSVDAGDEVEFHWVYTNCDLPTPARPGLENCVCDRADMVLRVYAQGYVVGAEGAEVSQPTEGLVQYVGSTTGPSYNAEVCSPARVNWEVNPDAVLLSKASLAQWCESNSWEGEDHPHESRAPVTRPDWLSPFAPPP